LDEEEDGADVWALGVSGRREVRAAAAVARRIGLAQELSWASTRGKNGKRERGKRAGGGIGPAGRKLGKEEKKRFCFSFSIALFQIYFQKVFETFLHLNQIQSSQKYNAAA
jgi:hypothetical protein